jgi:hypothetical protein
VNPTESAGTILRQDWRWLRSPAFDFCFLAGLPAFAALVGAAVVAWPQIFFVVLVYDLWFLGYHHVIATYTRICFDRASFSQRWHLLALLLPAVVVATIGVAYVFGLWIIVSIYYYWQWFHYTRQSWGISRVYRAKDRTAEYEGGYIDQAIFYALPILGISYRSWQDPKIFLGMELWSFPVPLPALQAVLAISVALTGFWIYRRVLAAIQNRLAKAHTLYMLSHFFIFFTGYILIDDVSSGWLVINIWHNAQYILFVWMFNNKRFEKGIHPEARFLSYISQPGRLALYLGACIGITGIIYWGVLRTIDSVFFAGLSATIVLYQIVNFHHYVVDSLIWKVRKPEVRNTLGLPG